MEKKTNVFLVTAKNEIELIKKINAERRKFFATQPIQKNDGTWVCFVYTNEEIETASEELATKKQIEYLQGLGVSFPKNVTKRGASKLIEENKNNI